MDRGDGLTFKGLPSRYTEKTNHNIGVTDLVMDCVPLLS